MSQRVDQWRRRLLLKSQQNFDHGHLHVTARISQCVDEGWNDLLAKPLRQLAYGFDFFRRGWALGLVGAVWGSENPNGGAMKSVITSRLIGFGIVGKVNPNSRITGLYSDWLYP